MGHGYVQQWVEQKPAIEVQGAEHKPAIQVQGAEQRAAIQLHGAEQKPAIQMPPVCCHTYAVLQRKGYEIPHS